MRNKRTIGLDSAGNDMSSEFSKQCDTSVCGVLFFNAHQITARHVVKQKCPVGLWPGCCWAVNARMTAVCRNE